MLAALVAGCAGDGARVPLPRGDGEAFAATVQPVLDRRCADPTCHGRPERPLAIYSATRWRRDPARTFLVEPLAPDEIAANVRGLCALALDERDSVDAWLVLRKTLPRGEGGASHTGGVVFTSRDDPEWRALRDWLASLERSP